MNNTKKKKNTAEITKSRTKNSTSKYFLFFVLFFLFAPYCTYIWGSPMFQLTFSEIFELYSKILHFFVFVVNHLRDVVRVWTSVCVL